jgi:hypothetical protein
MKKTILLFATILVAGVSQAQIFGKKIKGNGNMTTETRTTRDYSEIGCAGEMDFILVKGTEGKITIEAESNLMEYIVTEVKGEKLVVKVKNMVSLRPSSNKEIKVTIPFDDVSGVSLAGSGDLWNEDTIDTNSLGISLAGSGDINLDVKADSVEGSLAGSGDMKLRGNTDKLEVKIAGSGDIKAFDLQANHTVASIAGSGDIEVVSNKSLKARVAGSGDIEYKGNPDKEDTKVSGSGTISN